MNGKHIKSLILNDEMDDKLLEDNINYNFYNTITGIFNSIFELLNNYDNKQNRELVNNLLCLSESIINNANNLNKLKYLDTNTKKLISDIHIYLSKEQLNKVLKVLDTLNDFNKIIKNKKSKELSYSRIKVIEDFIYCDNNIKRVRNLVKSNNNILDIKDSKDENILYKVLKKYNDSDDIKEIEYLYEVIILFLYGNYNKEIINNKSYYLDALSNVNKKHVSDVIYILNGNKIELSSLESKYNINLLYPTDIEKEMYSYNYKCDNIVDYRKQESITIDGVGSECLDDALYIKKNIDGSYTLYIHIAYVPSIVLYNSNIDMVARKRMETLYLCDTISSMYPEYIANYRGSLLPNNNRYCETGIVLLDSDFNVIEDTFKIVKSKINSHHRLSYDVSDKLIEKDNNDNLTEELKLLGMFALSQKKKNLNKEKYRNMENLLYSNPRHESVNTDSSISSNIVQESMILYNELKAKYYKKMNLPYIYRCLDNKNSDIIDDTLLKKINIDYEAISKKDLVSLKKSLSFYNLNAYYSDVPKRHNGLNKRVYSHSSSALRRYADAFGQYLDEYLLFNSNVSDKDIYLWESKVKDTVNYLNNNYSNIENFSNQYNYLKSRKLIK